MLISWNRSYSNLISRNDESRFVTRHLLESLEPARLLRDCGASRWLDLGSGGGLPAIPLAVAGVGSSWTLVESRRTKTLFLRRAVQELELTQVEVVNSRLDPDTSGAFAQGSFDGFISRATLPLDATLAIATALVKVGGVAFLWKGSTFDRELDQAQRHTQWKLVGTTKISAGGAIVARFDRQ